jgi:hypothetical protein
LGDPEPGDPEPGDPELLPEPSAKLERLLSRSPFSPSLLLPRTVLFSHTLLLEFVSVSEMVLVSEIEFE